MDENTKKTLYLLTIVLCLAAAVVIASMNIKKKDKLPPEGQELYWIKCRNPKCEHQWQMDKRHYFEYLMKNQKPDTMLTPAIPCPKCAEQSGYRAEMCLQCGLVFERGSVPNDFADRCPNCSFSNTEQKRKQPR